MLAVSNTSHPQLIRLTEGRTADRAFGRVAPITVYAVGSEIYGQGETSGTCYQIEFGAVRICRLREDGRRQIVAFHLPGEVFGFEPDDIHHFYAEAVSHTALRSFRQASSGEASLELLKLTMRSMIRAQEHSLLLAGQSSFERVATFLVDMMERQGGVAQVDLPMSRQDMADYLGLTIETVSRTMTKLRSEGVIQLAGMRSIEVLKPAYLQRLCR
ncbi:Nitrogen fixation regulation protein FixK [Ensifer sp. M14]|uniref:helix-turn-helix domain-containing protein n=1 Tax=Ensifer sp. M14 TaxID=2203782 RepID=UPI000E1CC8DE|nr:helix-turn-helix domain-containing protein [Ensifer sp. M14]RDL48419.1 Nitrogen fixation regulation protein FixK [Ensifer sp. M14]